MEESVVVLECRNTAKHSAILSFIIIMLGLTLFFILFEFIFFSLLNRMKKSNISEIWILQVMIITFYGFFVFLSFYSRIFRILISILMLLISLPIFLIVLFRFESLLTLKVILGFFTCYSFLCLIQSLRSWHSFIIKIKIKPLILILLIFFSFILTSLVICFLPKNIEIEPRTEPECIFWCGSSELPNDTDILEMCRKYNIGFMATIRRNMVGDKEYMQVYKNVISHGVNLYFCIGGESGFFANIDNAEEFPVIYNEIRAWFLNESILNSPHITSFSIDAEPPKKYFKNMNKNDIIGTIEYGYDNYPTRKEKEKATDALKDFTEAIRQDGKKCGIVRAAQLLDSIDNDNDLSLFTRNVHTLDIEWDFTVTMLYRTNELQDDETEVETPKLLVASLNYIFGAIVEGTKYTNSELSFYQNVALEQNSGDTLAKEQFIFIGNFEKEFEDTQYIKNKNYKRDLDICRHFKEEKVFFYELHGFLAHYGWEGIQELGEYNKQDDKWDLQYSNGRSNIFFAFYCSLVIIDMFVFFERDLS